MPSRNTTIFLATAILGVSAYALLRTENAPVAVAATPRSNLTPLATTNAPTGIPGPLPMGDSTPLPPGHPAIGGATPATNDDPASLTWTAPAAWKVLPNPNAMRLATYQVPRAAGDSDDADVSVTRAGGTPDANIERWLTQFDDRGKDTRTVSTIRGMKITVVDVGGTYLGSGMTPGAAPVSHRGWALLAAIVEGPGVPYFVKITGPAATVKAARPGFDALLASVTKS
jgi:hypothetical protein